MRTLNFKVHHLVLLLFCILCPIILILWGCESFLDEHVSAEEESYVKRYSELLSPKIKAQTIIIGASNSAHGLIPSELKLSSTPYNFSFNGADYIFQKKLYENFIRTYQTKPKNIIIALSPSSFLPFWRKIESDEIYINKARDKHNSLKDAIKNLKIRHLSVVALEIYLRLYEGDKQTDTSGMVISKYDNGYVPFERSSEYLPEKMPPLIFPVEEVESLKHLIRLAKYDGNKVILVEMPTPNGVYNERELAYFRSLVESIARSYSVKIYLANDFNKLYGDNFTIFNDNVHLRNSGAILYSREIGNWLRADGGL